MSKPKYVTILVVETIVDPVANDWSFEDFKWAKLNGDAEVISASTEIEGAANGYDPIRDEDKPFTLREFAGSLRQCVTHYERTFGDTNEFHKQPHTWSEWLRSFIHYMSW